MDKENVINPLSTNVGYAGHKTVVTSDSYNSLQLLKEIDIFVEELDIFYKMVYKTL